MNKLALLPLAALVSALAAQSNTVAGLDGRLTVVDDLTFYGRRGAAYPNGEVGMAMLNTMCNPGSVNIPWFAAMQPDHPKFGFIVVRVAGDRIEQISDWSYCKHAFLSVNVNGSCGSCQNPGTGSLMGLNCSDTYSAGNNADRFYLGPPAEIDPWLGTWNPIGSYFDRGDPNVGAPQNMDGVRSLSFSQVSAFDSVKNRVTVKEQDLLTPNAQYYYGIQLIHQGEALANRWDNNAHRGFTPNGTGGSWSFPNNAASQQYGSILDRWAGAMVEEGHNGADDGRFYVASKVTPLGGGLYHFEYAVHNMDNSRAGATLRIPIDATATASNFTFGDIDQDPLNDWTATRVGNEIVFQGPAAPLPANPLEWNTIYNFGFDADYAPGLSTCAIDQARIGPGALSVTVQTQVPGGTTIATFATFGQSCDGSTVVPVPPCAQINPSGGQLTNLLSSSEYVYRVANPGPVAVEWFDVFTASTGGSVSVEARIYANSGALPPAATPLATTTMTIDATPGFYRATFNPPVQVTGSYYIGFDNTAQTVFVNRLVGGLSAVVYSRPNASSAWALSVMPSAYVVSCATPTTYLQPTLANVGLPLVGTTYGLSLSDALASSVAVLVSGSSNTSAGGAPLPAALPGAPGCDLLVSPDVIDAALIDPTGLASASIAVPNNSALVGISLFHQWAVLDAGANALGIATSNAGEAVIGS